MSLKKTSLIAVPFVLLLVIAGFVLLKPSPNMLQISDKAQLVAATGVEKGQALYAANPVGLLDVKKVSWDFWKKAPTTQWAVYNPETKIAAKKVNSEILISQSPGGRSAIIKTGVPVSSVSKGWLPPVTEQVTAAKNSSFKLGGEGVIIGVYVLTLFAMVGLTTWLILTIRGGGTGKAGTMVEVPSTTLKDVAGADDAVEDVEELVDMIKNPQAYIAAGVSRPAGALLYGPPGTGKTLLARAVAGTAGVPFYAASGSDFVEKFVGVGSSRIRKLFEEAKEHPGGAVVFIDEIDAIGRSRSNSDNGSGREQEATLNALLVEIDGFDPSSKVVVIGATNRKDMLDPALLRPGRLSRHIAVGLPDLKGRKEVLEYYLGKKYPEFMGKTAEHLAGRTPGASPAQLEQIVNEALLMGVRDGNRKMTVEDLDGAVATVLLGKIRASKKVSKSDKEVTAWHEAGHAVAGMALEDGADPVYVTILPRANSGGSTWRADNDSQFRTREQMWAGVVAAMAGRAAEEIWLDGRFTSGPHGDLAAATNQVWVMLSMYGMTDGALVSLGNGISMEQAFSLDPDLRKKVDDLLHKALAEARTILQDNILALTALAELLLNQGTLGKGELDEFKNEWFSTTPVVVS